MIVYVAGPMTGLPDYNRAAFDAAADLLHEAGHETRNPAGLSRAVERDGQHIDEHPRTWYLRHALRLLLDSDGVALLDGWEASAGARLEHAIATELGIPVHTLAGWLR